MSAKVKSREKSWRAIREVVEERIEGWGVEEGGGLEDMVREEEEREVGYFWNVFMAGRCVSFVQTMYSTNRLESSVCSTLEQRLAAVSWPVLLIASSRAKYAWLPAPLLLSYT